MSENSLDTGKFGFLAVRSVHYQTRIDILGLLCRSSSCSWSSLTSLFETEVNRSGRQHRTYKTKSRRHAVVAEPFANRSINLFPLER